MIIKVIKKLIGITLKMITHYDAINYALIIIKNQKIKC